MEQFRDLVEKKGLVEALHQEAAAALSHPRDTFDSLAKPAAAAALTVGALYLVHRIGPAAVEKGAEVLRPLAKELGTSFDFDLFSHMGPNLALADGARLGERSTLGLDRRLKTTADEFKHKPLEMTSTGGTGGGAADINYREWKNSSGERELSFNNIPVGNTTNFFEHPDGSKVHFQRQGGLYMQFPGSAETRMVDIKMPISSVHIQERSNGINEYRFNGEKSVSMMINPRFHDVVAYPANGDRVFIADNSPSGIIFTHSRGGAIHVGSDGRIAVVPPDRDPLHTMVNEPFKQAYFTEHPDGSATLRLSDPSGKMFDGEIRAEASLMTHLPVPDPLRPKNLAPQRGSAWRPPLQRNSPVHQPNANNIDYDRYDAGAPGHHDPLNPFNIPMSPERAIDARITGVSGGMVSNNTLDSPADMFTAMWADGNRWLARDLINLGKPEDY